MAAPALREAYLAWNRVQTINRKGVGEMVELKTLKEAAKVYTNHMARVAAAAEERGEAHGRKLGEVRGVHRAYVDMARWKFGADAAERLAGLLAGVTDRLRLARLGRLLMECESGDELIAEAGDDWRNGRRD